MSSAGTADDPLVGQVLDGRYRVDRRLGAGGMGSVYLATHLLMETQVAIKVLAAERATDGSYAKRFVREARNTFRFDHPNCVRVSDFGATPDGILYLVMEYLPGRTVGEDLHVSGPMSPRRVLHIAIQVASALSHSHDLGLVHRDLKPDNLMLITRHGDHDFVKVFDFGLAKFYDQEGPIRTAMSLSPLTQHGMVFGTPEYMAPEQARGKQLGPASDLYALGVVIYEMLTTTVPFSAHQFMKVLAAHIKEPVEPPSERRPDLVIPGPLEQIVMWCLEKDPAARPPDAATLTAALERILPDIKPPAARVSDSVAASETMDLSDAAPQLRAVTPHHQPATTPGYAAPPPHASPAVGSGDGGTVATPEPADTAETRQVRVSPGEHTAREAPPPSPAQTAEMRLPPPSSGAHARRPIGAIVAVLAVFGVIGGVTAYALSQSPSSFGAADSGPIAAVSTEPASEPGDAAVPVAVVETQTDAAVYPDAGVPGEGQVPAGPGKTRRQLRAEKHVVAAEAGRKSGNVLRWLSEADTAYELDPRNRRAQRLFGEALVASGSRERGCRHLRRFRRAWRKAGCHEAGTAPN